jgi:hypothetical protein
MSKTSVPRAPKRISSLARRVGVGLTRPSDSDPRKLLPGKIFPKIKATGETSSLPRCLIEQRLQPATSLFDKSVDGTSVGVTGEPADDGSSPSVLNHY